MRTLLPGLFAAAAALGWLAAQAADPALPAAVGDGQALAEEIRSTPPPEDLDVNGVLRIRAHNGRRSAVPFRYRVIPGPDAWQFRYDIPPTAGGPGQSLVVLRSPHAAPVYILAEGTNANPTAEASVCRSGDDAMVPFAGSDFWLADLGLDFLHWPQQRIDTSTRLTMRKGRSCKVLESVNPRPGAAGYTRVRAWVDLKTRGIILAEAYGADGKLLKEFEVGGFTKVEGQWELKNMEIRNLRSDTRTILEFKYTGRD